MNTTSSLASKAPTAREIHALTDWRQTLAALGVDPERLRNRHGPCPGCGGDDRFRFDDKGGRGTWICSAGGAAPLAGDGFALLEHVHGWTFTEARREVLSVLGLDRGRVPHTAVRSARPPPAQQEIARPGARVRDLMRTATEVSNVPDAVAYLASRSLWPLPAGAKLLAHAAAPYWHDGEQIGRFPALICPVRDLADDLVTLHVTYLSNGAKLQGHPARKLLSAVQGRQGCAVRLAPAGSVLGVAEGVETALAASARFSVPVWSCLNAGLLAKFAPPAGVDHLIVFADRDVAGLEAAWKLRDRMPCELRLPPAPAGDWAEVQS